MRRHEAYVVPEGYRGIQETVVVQSVLCQHTRHHSDRNSDDDRRLNGPRRSRQHLQIRLSDLERRFTMQLECACVSRQAGRRAVHGSENRRHRAFDSERNASLIDSIFRNQASESSAMAYLQNRHEEQRARRSARARASLEVSRRRRQRADLPHSSAEELMKTQTKRSSRSSAEHVQRAGVKRKRNAFSWSGRNRRPTIRRLDGTTWRRDCRQTRRTAQG